VPPVLRACAGEDKVIRDTYEHGNMKTSCGTHEMLLSARISRGN
jgi:hypothetical protein